LKYPLVDASFYYSASLEPLDGPIDLSQIAISIEKPTEDEIKSYASAYGKNSFISFVGANGKVKVEKLTIE
jgi:hypothetical protein